MTLKDAIAYAREAWAWGLLQGALIGFTAGFLAVHVGWLHV